MVDVVEYDMEDLQTIGLMQVHPGVYNFVELIQFVLVLQV